MKFFTYNLLSILGCLLTLVNRVTSIDGFQRYAENLDKLSRNKTFMEAFERHVIFSSKVKVETFSCDSIPPSQQKPESVHRLMPGDIHVVAAMGWIWSESKNIAWFVDRLARCVMEEAPTIPSCIGNGGLLISIGGDATVESVVTLPNMIKVYNPNVKGFSVKTGDEESENAHLNVAVSGATSSDIPRQTKELIDKMKYSTDVDFANDWKLITIMVGGNDLCASCKDKVAYSAQNYKKNLQDSLDMLYKEVPRTFVNLVPVFHINMIRQLRRNLFCYAFHIFGCTCMAVGCNEQFDEINQLNEQYQQMAHDLVDDGRYDDREDFTVVVQPFFEELQLPLENGEPDYSYFAPDCSHLSESGHEAAAGGLWNNMIAPVGEKQRTWNPGQTINCPTEEHPYFYTKKNSVIERRSMALGNTASSNSTKREDTSSSSVLITLGGLSVCVLLVAIAVTIKITDRKSMRRRFSEESTVLLIN